MATITTATPTTALLVPSRTRKVQHQVNLATGSCSCEKLQYTPRKRWLTTQCEHKRVAQWSVRLKVSVEAILARLARAKERGCCGEVTCYFCATASNYICPRTPEARAIFQGMRNEVKG